MSDDHPFYKYDPNRGAALAYAIIFGVTTLTHIYQCLRTRTWYMTAFILGGLFETVGYIARYISIREPRSTAPYIVQTLLILIAPALLAASMYMVLSRIILVTQTESLSPIRRTWLTRIFVGGDIISFLVQVLGGGILASGTTGDKPDADRIKLGENVVIVGLFVQLLFFGFFLVVGLWWKSRVGRRGMVALAARVPWKKHFIVLMVASALVFVRSVFRVIEYVMGDDGYLLEHEVFAYVFDAVLMDAVMVLYNVVHPSDVTKPLKEVPRGDVEEEYTMLPGRPGREYEGGMAGGMGPYHQSH
ncbi:putative rta1 domain protein [Lasiodiplodia theobromae]|uniref:Rta1 domain protein n=1 Tax=Lasiodiplodia theobromae TaxID=45133 RepID=UPI0015C349B4|nr:Rta1 domain protein [Lasiodiplodia theobromae]KAF4535016.1 Rta1 domain protein [Lasiodiplodia theobromae]KAF9641514.1 putative rta1 domain protein [Lasiodiplodia theobromae]